MLCTSSQGDGVPASLRTILHLVSGLLILSMLAKHLVSRRLRDEKDWALVWSVLNDDQLMLAALFMPAVVISIGGLAGGSLLPLAALPILVAFALYVVVLLVLLGGYLLIARHVAARERGGMALALYDLNTAIIVAGAPLMLIPLGGLVANEIQFTLPAVGPRGIGFVVVVILAAALGDLVLPATPGPGPDRWGRDTRWFLFSGARGNARIVPDPSVDPGVGSLWTTSAPGSRSCRFSSGWSLAACRYWIFYLARGWRMLLFSHCLRSSTVFRASTCWCGCSGFPW